MPFFSSREKWPAERSSLLAIISTWHLIPLPARPFSLRGLRATNLHVGDLAAMGIRVKMYCKSIGPATLNCVSCYSCPGRPLHTSAGHESPNRNGIGIDCGLAKKERARLAGSRALRRVPMHAPAPLPRAQARRGSGWSVGRRRRSVGPFLPPIMRLSGSAPGWSESGIPRFEHSRPAKRVRPRPIASGVYFPACLRRWPGRSGTRSRPSS